MGYMLWQGGRSYHNVYKLEEGSDIIIDYRYLFPPPSPTVINFPQGIELEPVDDEIPNPMEGILQC